MQIKESQEKIQKKPFVSEIRAFEIVAVNSAFSGGDTWHRQLMC